MPIFKTAGYRNTDCLLSVAAIFPPEGKHRTSPDNKNDNDEIMHFAIVNNKNKDGERSAYIDLTKKQLIALKKIIDEYLITGITKEI